MQVLHGMHTDDPSYLLRIDKATGKTVWRVLRMTRARFESPDAYTTPALLRHGKSTEIVITGGDVVTGHDPATGQELWRADGLNPNNDGSYRIVASPVVHGDLLFAPSRERPLLALKPGGRGDVTASHVLWSFNNGPDVPTPVTDGTYLYSINDRGILYCLDARTGQVVYGPQRLRNATYSGSAVLADGEDLHHRRRRRHDRVSSRPKVRVAVGERSAGLHAQLARGFGWTDLRSHGFVHLCNRTETGGGEEHSIAAVASRQ